MCERARCKNSDAIYFFFIGHFSAVEEKTHWFIVYIYDVCPIVGDILSSQRQDAALENRRLLLLPTEVGHYSSNYSETPVCSYWISTTLTKDWKCLDYLIGHVLNPHLVHWPTETA